MLGPDVDIVIRPIDETNTRVLPERLMAEIERSGGKGLICLVGVQTNQFPHAVNLARQFLKATTAMLERCIAKAKIRKMAANQIATVMPALWQRHMTPA